MSLKSSAEMQAYEQYVLTDKKLDPALNKLVEGSEAYMYLKFLHILNERALTKEEKMVFKEYKKSGTEDAQKLRLRSLLRSYDTTKDQAKKDRILSKLASDYLNLRFDDERPHELSAFSTPEQRDFNNVPMDCINLSQEYEMLYNGKKAVSEFTMHGLVDLDFSKFTDKDSEFLQILSKLGQLVALCESPDFFKTFVTVFKKRFESHKSFPWGTILNSLTLTQLEKIKSSLPEVLEDSEFVGNYMKKLFYKEMIGDQSKFTKAERRTNLLTLYNFACGLPVEKGLRAILLLELLYNGMCQNIYEEKYFLEYLEKPLRMNTLKKVAKHSGHEWIFLFSSVISEEFKSGEVMAQRKDRELFEAHLIHFFQSGKPISRYEEYFDKKFLLEIWEKSQIMSGKKVEFTKDNAKRLEQIKDMVEISICKHNKETFSLGEDIAIDVKLKNVPSLMIKIFEINAENYYCNNLSDFNTGINLDGFVATIESKIEYSQAQSIQHKESISFPEIKNKTGLFVIEMIGNGKSARAVIKIGSLFLISQITPEGDILTILDSEKKICSGENTGIWLKKVFYKANADPEAKGSIKLPFLPSKEKQKGVLVHGNIAELVEVKRNQESYQLYCGVFMHPEALIMGNKATMAIHPELLLNNTRVSVNLIQNFKVEVMARNSIENSQTYMVFDSLTLEEGKDVEVGFNVIPHLESIKVKISGLIKDKIKVESEYDFFQDYKNQFQIEDFHFRYTNPGPNFELVLLGKNGEPISHKQIKVKFYTNLLFSPIDRMYLTDASGSIRLGKLQGVVSFKASTTLCNGEIERQFRVPLKAFSQMQNFFELLENESLDLPSSLNNKISLLKVYEENEAYIIDNVTHYVKIPPKEIGQAYTLIHIENLPEGKYQLLNLEISTPIISINVIKGRIWKENPEYIETPNSLNPSKNRGKFVRIKSTHTEEKDATNTNILVQLDSSHLEKCCTHIVLFNFLADSMSNLSKTINQNFSRSKKHFLPSWNNTYFSNRLLSSELRYCIERRQFVTLTGSTLDKPGLLLKPNLLGTTKTEAETLLIGNDYEDIYNKKMPAQKKAAKGAKQRMLQQRICSDKKCREEEECEKMDICDYEEEENYEESGISTNFCEFQNFLQPPSFFFNAKPDSKGLVSVSISKALLSQYSGLFVVTSGENIGSAHYLHSLTLDKIHKKNLCLQKPFEEEKNYSEVRVATGILKNETHLIDDIASTNFAIINSLAEVYNIMKQSGQEDNGSLSDHSKEFGFLTNWKKLSEEEKHNNYAKYSSHELHLFLYFKDPAFFKSIVRPHLANKMEKTLVDLYLLEVPLKEYYEKPYVFQKLNFLEKALLVHSLVKEKNLPKAKQLAALMEYQLPEETESILGREQRIFDAIMMQNIMEREVFYQDATAEEEGECCEECEDDEGGEDENRYGNRRNRRRPHRMHGGGGGEDDEEDDDGSADMDEDGEFMGRKKMKKVLPPYQESGGTKMFVETNYYGQSQFETQDICSPNKFLVDFVKHVIECAESKPKSFLSPSFAYIDSCMQLTPFICPLIFLDLPFDPVEHGYKSIKERGREIKAASNCIILKKEVRQASLGLQSSLLLGQRYLENGVSQGEDIEVREFLTQKVYHGQVVVTNTSNHDEKFDLLFQVPQGSIPVDETKYQKTVSITLESFNTCKEDYYFYFPQPGTFLHASPMASKNCVVIAKNKQTPIQVSSKKITLSKEDFRDIVANGTPDHIMEFLRDHSLESIKQFDWNLILWMLGDCKFWGSLVKLLRSQGRFEKQVWKYAFLHKKDPRSIYEYLISNIDFKKKCGFCFNSSLVDVVPIEVMARHLHYFPLINPRVHRISLGPGSSSEILNVNLRNAYYQLIHTLMEKKVWDTTDKLCLCYYLLLQDKITEAQRIFTEISAKSLPKGGALQLQYDYMLAYFDFFLGAPKFANARRIAAQYRDYPIYSWMMKFLAIEQQLKEYDGVEKSEEEEEKEAIKKKTGKVQPSLVTVIQGKELIIDYQNLTQIDVKYYLIDLEVMFSRSPFLAQQAEDFGFVQPTHSTRIELNPKQKQIKVPIPEKYINKNAVIEIKGAEGTRNVVTFFSTFLKIHIYENYGELQVMDEAEKLQPEVYIKVFAKHNTKGIKFYKDGYTDIRGRFNYATLNSDSEGSIQKFSILIMSEKLGSRIRECNPPAEFIKKEGEQYAAQGRLVSYQQVMQKNKDGWTKTRENIDD